MAQPDLSKQLEKMRRDWDARAKENARHYVSTGKKEWTDEEFFRSGEQTVSEEIRTDMINICQGKDPKQMKVLEIGCGAGRITRALAGLFGEVHAVDVSGEMVAQARAALADRPPPNQNYPFWRGVSHRPYDKIAEHIETSLRALSRAASGFP